MQDADKVRIYVNPLPSGLYRIRIESKNLIGPLVDGKWRGRPFFV